MCQITQQNQPILSTWCSIIPEDVSQPPSRKLQSLVSYTLTLNMDLLSLFTVLLLKPLCVDLWDTIVTVMLFPHSIDANNNNKPKPKRNKTHLIAIKWDSEFTLMELVSVTTLTTFPSSWNCWLDRTLKWSFEDPIMVPYTTLQGWSYVL